MQIKIKELVIRCIETKEKNKQLQHDTHINSISSMLKNCTKNTNRNSLNIDNSKNRR